jgi:hypothetical protein
MSEKKRKIRFKDWYDQERIAGSVRNTLDGTWRNSSGCWNEDCLHIWYRGSENKTYVHFPCGYCYTWEGDVVKTIIQRIKSFIRRIK